jgi:hypothetical protein
LDSNSKNNTRLTQVEPRLAVMESELVKTKQKLGEVVDAIMDCTDEALCDRVQEIINSQS